MKRIIRIYRQLLIANVGKTLVYRADFINSVLSGILWGGFSMVMITLLTANVSEVAGWKSEEIQMLNAGYWIIAGIFHFFFTRNFSNAARVIHYGEIDSLSLKPISSLFLITTSDMGLSSIVRFTAGFFLMEYLAHRHGIELQFLNWVLFFVLGLVGVAILYAVHVFLISLLLWKSYLSNLIELGSLLMSTARNPLELLSYVPRTISVFFFLALITVSIPTRVLLGKGNSLHVAVLISVAVILLFLSKAFWNYSLKHYTGASS